MPRRTPAGRRYVLGADLLLTEVEDRLARSLLLPLGTGLAVLVASLLVALLSIRRVVRPLGRLVDTTAEAIDTFRRMVQDDDGFYFDERELDGLGYRLIRLDRIEEAVAVFRLGVDVLPTSWQLWDALGEAYHRAGDTAQARQAFIESLKLKAEQPPVREVLERLGGVPPELRETPSEAESGGASG